MRLRPSIWGKNATEREFVPSSLPQVTTVWRGHGRHLAGGSAFLAGSRGGCQASPLESLYSSLSVLHDHALIFFFTGQRNLEILIWALGYSWLLGWHCFQALSVDRARRHTCTRLLIHVSIYPQVWLCLCLSQYVLKWAGVHTTFGHAVIQDLS